MSVCLVLIALILQEPFAKDYRFLSRLTRNIHSGYYGPSVSTEGPFISKQYRVRSRWEDTCLRAKPKGKDNQSFFTSALTSQRNPLAVAPLELTTNKCSRTNSKGLLSLLARMFLLVRTDQLKTKKESLIAGFLADIDSTTPLKNGFHRNL